MIIVKLTDGLGNQMFQYAYARCIQIYYGENKLYLDVTKLGKKHARRYGLHHFRLNENVVIPNPFVQYLSRIYVKILLNLLYRILRISTTSEKGVRFFSKCGLYTNTYYYYYFPIEYTSLPIKFIRGFFQNERYFYDISEIIKNEFHLKDCTKGSDLKKMEADILHTNSVCVHIRRGDYLNNKKFKVCTEYYYKKAIEHIKAKYPDAVFYVFSNTTEDVEWVKVNYSLGENIRYVGLGNTEIEDFNLMMHCRHFIIANSTFSWWAAYLSDAPEKIVIAPKPWVNDNEYQDGIYCKGWKIINTY